VIGPAAGSSGAVPGIAPRAPSTKLDLRGDPGDPRFLDAVHRVLGLALPLVPGTSVMAERTGTLWLGPDEWLVVSGDETPEALTGRLRAALEGLPAAVTDVSDARVVLRVSGPAARDLLAKGCSLDLHGRAFGPGACAQTLLARVPVLLHRPGPGDDLDVHVPRSFAEHLRAWLADASLEFLA
jgi:sarcosine oxidase subunit gamma